MAASAGTADSSGAAAIIDERLLEAAASGNATILKHLVLRDPGVLLGTTPQGNTCLHVSSLYGHLSFCTDAVVLNRYLLSSVNAEGETPLLVATTSGHAALVSFFLKQYCCDLKLKEAILKQDKEGCNALHHAIRNGHRELALELIAAEPALSRALNKCDESPMFISVMRNYEEIFEKLSEIPDAEAKGASGWHALHAAVRSGNTTICKRIMETRPGLARKECKDGASPMLLAIHWNKIDVVRVLLERDRSLGYEINTKGQCLLDRAALRGHVGVARELLKHCPDAPYRNRDGWTCLHKAVWYGREAFLEFVLGSQQLRKLINMRSSEGKTPLHYAVAKCNPRMVAALLRREDIDVTVLDNCGQIPTWFLYLSAGHAKTLNWNEVSMLMLKANPEEETDVHISAKDVVTNKSRTDIMSLTQTYTSNTSLVAILMSTITFTAAFHLVRRI